MSISSTTPVESSPTRSKMQPLDPWTFAKQLEGSQEGNLFYTHNILFNKGRYFETSIYEKELIQQVSNLSGIPITYNNMIVGSWDKMEDFVIAMNILGYRVTIKVDWI